MRLFQFNDIKEFKNNNLLKAYKNDATYDIRSANQIFSLAPKCSRIIYTGLHINIPPGWKGTIKSISGLGIERYLEVSNSSIINAGDINEIIIKLHNITNNNPIIVNFGDRIAQIEFNLSYTVMPLRFLFTTLPQKIPEISFLDLFDKSEHGIY